MMQLEFALDPAPELQPGQKLRQLALPGGTLSFSFSRSRRRTLTILVKQGRVEVRSPRWAPIAEVEAFVREKERWIRRRLEESRRTPPRMTWREGERLPFLGEELSLKFDQTETIRREGSNLHLPLEKSGSPLVLRASVIEWLCGEAMRLFVQRVALHAPRLGVREPTLRLSRSRTPWGSCNAHGRVLLNWRLIHVPVRLVDYVVAHELAHLRELNHSPRFWALVESVYPDCRAARRELNRLEKTLPEL